MTRRFTIKFDVMSEDGPVTERDGRAELVFDFKDFEEAKDVIYECVTAVSNIINTKYNVGDDKAFFDYIENDLNDNNYSSIYYKPQYKEKV